MSDVVAELERERRALLGTIAGIDETMLDRKGVVGDWSIKNVLAHLAGWEEWIIRALPIMLAGGELPEDLRAAARDENRYNREQVAEREELTPGEQLMELERIRATLIEYIRTLDEATLNRPQPWPRWKGTLAEYFFTAVRDHDAEHREMLEAAVAQLPRSL